jgi:alpha-tubulin suppressor-like RCC1 family protein
MTAIAAGDNHTVALKNDGTIRAWGNNSNGQLGDDTTSNRTTPVQVNRLSDMTAIAAGDNHTVALKKDGTAWAWGNNSYGQLGDGTTTDRTTPVQVQSLQSVSRR